MAAALTSGHSRWLVVLSSFIMYFLVHCSLRALPILYVELVDIFQAGKSATAWVPALQEFMFKGSGVLVAPFIKKFGCRAVAIVGTVIAAGGYIGGMFSSNIVELVFSVGFTAVGPAATDKTRQDNKDRTQMKKEEKTRQDKDKMG